MRIPLRGKGSKRAQRHHIETAKGRNRSFPDLRHPGLDPGPAFFFQDRQAPDQVRGDDDREVSNRPAPTICANPIKNRFPNKSRHDLPYWMTRPRNPTPISRTSRHPRLSATKETFRTRTAVSFVALRPQRTHLRCTHAGLLWLQAPTRLAMTNRLSCAGSASRRRHGQHSPCPRRVACRFRGPWLPRPARHNRRRRWFRRG